MSPRPLSAEAYAEAALRREVEMFASHEVRRRGGCGTRWELWRREPDGRWEGDRWFEVVTLGGGAIVHGDVDMAAWEGFRPGPGNREPRGVVAWVARMARSLDYGWGKARMALGASATEHVAAVALWELDRLLDPEGGLTKRQRGAVNRLREALESHDLDVTDVARRLYRADLLEAESVESFGAAPSDRFLTGVAAVARLHEILSGGAEANLAWLGRRGAAEGARRAGGWAAIYEGCVAFEAPDRADVLAWAARQGRPEEVVLHEWPSGASP